MSVRPLVTLVVTAAVVCSLMASPIPAAAQSSRESSPGTWRVLPDGPDDRETVHGYPVSMAEDGKSIGWSEPHFGYGNSHSTDHYWVLDQQPDPDDSPLLKELDAPGQPTEFDGASQLSADGKSFVATYQVREESDLGACSYSGSNPDAGVQYWHQQIIKWNRGEVGEDFDNPTLISKRQLPASTGCDPTAVPPGGGPPMMGRGGNDDSDAPSISRDGTTVAFTSLADDLGATPAVPYTKALYAWTEGQGLTMVTPPTLELSARDPMISADGNHIVFASSSELLVNPAPPSGTHIYMATRPSPAGAWSIELVSTDANGDPAMDGSSGAYSTRPAVDEAGDRIAFLSYADNLDPGVADPVDGPTLYVKDLSLGSVRAVVNRKTSPAAHHLGNAPGTPKFSLDGERVTIYGRSDSASFASFGAGSSTGQEGQLLVFNTDKVLSTTASQRRASRIVRRAYDNLANYRSEVAIAGDDGNYLVAFPSQEPPLPGFAGSPGALYFLGGGSIGPDMSRGWHGDPVDTATGNFRQEETDLAAPGDAGPATVARVYNSFGDASGVFGPGWMSTIDTHLELDLEIPSEEGDTATLVAVNGQRIVFVSDASGNWSPLDPYRISLTRPGPSEWAVTGPDGSVQRFNDVGQLTSLEAPGVPTVTITWGPATPQTVTSDSGYQVSFTDDTSYDSDSNPVTGGDGYVDRAVSSDGRQVDYTYQRSDPFLDGVVLSRVSRPHAVGQDPDSYGFRDYVTDDGLITAIKDVVAVDTAPDPFEYRTVVANVYDDWGRVVEQSTADGDLTTFAYDQAPDPPGGMIAAPGFTTVTDTASGDVTVYEHNGAGELIGVTDALGHDVSRSWDGDRPASAESRSGVVTDYVYDAAGRVEEVTETVGAETRTVESVTYVVADTDPTAGTDDRIETRTDASGVTTTFSYDGAARQPETVSVPCDPASTAPETPCPASGLSTTSYTYFTGTLEGLVESQTDADGVVTTFTYHPDRSLASTTVGTGPDALTTTVETLEVGDPGWAGTDPPVAAVELTRTTAPGGAVTVEFRDAEGRAIESRDPLYDGITHLATITAYSLDGELASVTDPAGATTTYEVTRAGGPGWAEAANIAEVRIVTDPDGVASITKSDRSGDVVVEQTGNPAEPATLATTTHTYGPLGRLVTTVGPDGVKTTFHYDDEGRTTGVTTGPDGNDPDRTVSTVYDQWGNTETTSTPAGPDPDGTPVTTATRFIVDDAGRTVAQIDGDGDPANALMTGFEYDTAGRLWRTIEHLDGTLDPADRYVIGTGDRVTETRYTPAGRTAAQVGPPPNATSFDWTQPDAAKSITTYDYDTAGRQATVTGPDGLDTVTAYGPTGAVDTVTTPGGFVTGYDYDDLGRTVRVTTPSGLTGPGDPATVQVDTTYTPTGLVATETDAYAPGVDLDPATREFLYTPGGRIDTATDANGDQVSYDYDARGNRTVRHSIDEDTDPIEETWAYDTADRLVSHREPHDAGTSGPATVYGYDADYGWLDTITDPTGRVETRRYYTNGTPRGETHTATGLATITVDRWIDSRGRATRRRDTTGTATPTDTAWTWTRDGQAVTAAHPGGKTIGYQWDLAGTISTVTHPDGAQGRYVHDSMGRVTDVAVSPTPTGTGVPLATMTYDDDGRLLTELLHSPAGSSRDRVYDPAGHLIDYTQVFEDGASGWDTVEATLGWRTDGRMATQSTDTGAGAVTESYDYDPAGQLTTVTGGPDAFGVTYGPRGNRTTVTAAGVTTAFDYHPSGAIAAASTSSAGGTTFSYDAAGRRTATATTNGSGATTGTSTTAYDAAGRTTAVATTQGSVTVTDTRAWDGDGNLSRLTHNQTGTWGWTLDYLWDTTTGMSQVLDQYLYGALHGRMDYANRNLGLQPNFNGLDYQWYGYDALGSVIDPNNNPTLVDGPDRHDPWGVPTPGTNTYPQGTYRGQDRFGNLIHLRAREYHPGTAQFTAPDPLDGIDGTPTAANPYHYTDNDPLNKTDPTGLRPTDCSMGTEAVEEAIRDARRKPRWGHVSRAYEEEKAEVETLQGILRASENDGSCILDFNDDGDGRIVEAFGNLQAASNIAVMVEGQGQNLSNQSARPKALAIREEANSLPQASNTATIAWLGYNSPDNYADSTGRSKATSGGESLVNFVKELRSRFPGKRVVTIGHSYGSVVIGEAISRGLSASDAVVTGSPGINSNSVGSTGYGGHLYVGAAPGDPVNADPIGSNIHGPPPYSLPDVRRLEVGGAFGHNAYYNPGSVSLTNIASVVTGQVRLRDGRWGL